MNAIAVAVPFFFLLMGVEALINRFRQGESGYQLQDTLNNLACGVGNQLVGLVSRLIPLALYGLLYEHVAPLHLPENPATLALAVVAIDLCYYWFHRAGHRVNLFWAGHAVHHQSEEMNLSVALRQSWFVQLISWVFYLPLALIGVSPTHFVIANLVITLYQFWIHTETVGRLWAPLEWVFNTASHHRVHHGTNPRYLDANYAGVFIVWDRLFGTFVPEEEEVVYGTVAPLRSWNPLWANLYYPVAVAKQAFAAKRWRDKLWSAFAPPEWRPQDLGGPVSAPEVSREAQTKYRPSASAATSLYAALHFLPAFGAALALLVVHRDLGPWQSLLVALWVVAGLQAIGGLLEAKRWARPFEVGRLLATLGFALWLPAPWAIAPLALVATSLPALAIFRVGLPQPAAPSAAAPQPQAG